MRLPADLASMLQTTMVGLFHHCCVLCFFYSWKSDFGWIWREVQVSMDYAVENSLDIVSGGGGGGGGGWQS